MDIFQIKKCDSDGCPYCSILNPPREENFDHLHFLPDPVLHETTDDDCPSLSNKQKLTDGDKQHKHLFTAGKRIPKFGNFWIV